MSTVSINVHCPMDGCGEEIVMECDIDPGDSNYGSDADGNRGMYVGPSVMACDPPEECPHCHTKYEQAELDHIAKDLEKFCAEYRYEPPDPYEP